MGQESCELEMSKGETAVISSVLPGVSLPSNKQMDNDGYDGSTKKMKIASLTEEDLGRSIRVDSLMNDEPPRIADAECTSPSDYKTLYLRESAKNEQLLQWVAQLQSRLNQQLQNTFLQAQTLSSPPARSSNAAEAEKLFHEGEAHTTPVTNLPSFHM